MNEEDSIVVQPVIITLDRRIIITDWELRIWNPVFPWVGSCISYFISYGAFTPGENGTVEVVFLRGPS